MERETAETAVSQGRIGLAVLHAGQGAAVGRQKVLRLVQKAQIQVCPQKASYKEFRRKVIELSFPPAAGDSVR